MKLTKTQIMNMELANIGRPPHPPKKQRKDMMIEYHLGVRELLVAGDEAEQLLFELGKTGQTYKRLKKAISKVRKARQAATQ